MQKKYGKPLALVLAALMALSLAACKPEEAPPEGPDIAPDSTFTFTPENYPKMGGSLAALPLGEAVTSAVLGVDRETASGMIVFEGSTTSNYLSLANGVFDILLAYEPSEEAKQLAKERGFEWEMTPIGRDALVFITGRDNPVDSLTLAQLQGIYAGEIINWKDAGGSDAAIIPYQRNKDSGSQTLFDKLMGLEGRLMEPPTEQIIGSMIGLLEVVADYATSKDALGYTVYYYLTNMETEKLDRSKILAVDGVDPSNETIASGEYALTNDFYVVIPKGLPADAPARVLYNWICSEQGLTLVEQENYVPVK